MPVWEGVRPGTRQNALLDWLWEAGGCADPQRASLFLYGDRSIKNKNRARSMFQVLEYKGLLIPEGKYEWKLGVDPKKASNTALEHRLQAAERRIQILENDLEDLLVDLQRLTRRLTRTLENKDV